VIVELEAKPGWRDELRSLIESVVATQGPSMRGYLGGELYEVLADPDTLVEIADWESAEARNALMEDPAAMDAMAPVRIAGRPVTGHRRDPAQVTELDIAAEVGFTSSRKRPACAWVDAGVSVARRATRW
jgi:quinol monooxygenase YgiN